MTENISLQIERNSIQAIIETHVQTAVMEALVPHKDRFVQELVEKSLLQKSTDNAYRYERDEKTPTVLEHMVRTIIAEEAKKAITRWAESHREEIAEKIHAAMKTKRFGRTIAAQIAEQMATASEYRFKLQVTPVMEE